MTILVGIPVKPFTVAKRRLSGSLDVTQRRRLGRAIAERTARLVAATGADVRIVTSSDSVSRWATGLGIGVLAEEHGGGLNGAARCIAAAADDEWAVVHADVALATLDELSTALGTTGTVIVPAHDGGTNVIKGRGRFPFSYGPGSFHRHLAFRPEATVLASPDLSFDLDTPHDLAVAVRLGLGAWLGGYVISLANVIK